MPKTCCAHSHTHITTSMCIMHYRREGLAKTIHVRCSKGILAKNFIKYTVLYGVCVRFWPTLRTSFHYQYIKIIQVHSARLACMCVCMCVCVCVCLCVFVCVCACSFGRLHRQEHLLPKSRIGQNQLYMVYIRYFWQEITKYTVIYGVF
jgi:hypothetical protein